VRFVEFVNTNVWWPAARNIATFVGESSIYAWAPTATLSFMKQRSRYGNP
jgi:hypothetical protein